MDGPVAATDSDDGRWPPAREGGRKDQAAQTMGRIRWRDFFFFWLRMTAGYR